MMKYYRKIVHTNIDDLTRYSQNCTNKGYMLTMKSVLEIILYAGNVRPLFSLITIQTLKVYDVFLFTLFGILHLNLHHVLAFIYHGVLPGFSCFSLQHLSFPFPSFTCSHMMEVNWYRTGMTLTLTLSLFLTYEETP